MNLIARQEKFVCALLTVILSGSLFTAVVFADDEPKTVLAGDALELTDVFRVTIVPM
jgi:hypothetical protein